MLETGILMDALVQFFTTVAVAAAATALSHFGMSDEGHEPGDRKAHSERSVKRTPAPQAHLVVNRAQV
jgi:Spy/CpxP family protein refolding chaperone